MITWSEYRKAVDPEGSYDSLSDSMKKFLSSVGIQKDEIDSIIAPERKGMAYIIRLNRDGSKDDLEVSKFDGRLERFRVENNKLVLVIT